MDRVSEQLRRAWLSLIKAEELAHAQAGGITDEWAFVAAELSRAGMAVEAASRDPLGPAEPDELPPGSCRDLARAAVAALRGIPWEQEPPGATPALLAAADALRAVERRSAAA